MGKEVGTRPGDEIVRDEEADLPYELKISRLTIDKLGVKLYDRVSAVVAELVANSYDADATEVEVSLPLGTLLTVGPDVGGEWTIIVRDDGHGLSPAEARKYYLRVGADRRTTGVGATSRDRGRPVMGRKGIGKLAPFGICRNIEVLSAGGVAGGNEFTVSHFHLDFARILSEDTDEPVVLKKGDKDGHRTAEHGTTVILTGFLSKKVPSAEVFMRQLERRFALADPDFKVLVNDTRDPDASTLTMRSFQIPIVEESKIDLGARPVTVEETGASFDVRGWMAMAKESYRNEEMAGVRIYARGKIVATTRDFEQAPGFTGEFATRSYLVGEVHADWLDDDEDEDLVRTDRQSILWESDKGNALRVWGAQIVREVARRGRKPRQDSLKKKFRKASNIENRARERFSDESVIKIATELADQIGGFAAEDELENSEYVEGLVQVILSVAPHQALVAAFKDFERSIGGGADSTVDDLIELFGKTRVAEAASYAQIASERMRVLDQLDQIVFDTARDEDALQQIIAEAPWLIQPDWTVITANQTLKTFKASFEQYLQRELGTTAVLAIEYETKRPDFTLVEVGGMLHFVEIKASGHALDDGDFDRLYNYVAALQNFFTANPGMATDFPRKWRIDVVVDSVNLRNAIKRRAYDEAIKAGELYQLSWDDFRARARRTNEAFLEVRDQAARVARNSGKISD